MKAQFYLGNGIQRPKGASNLPIPQSKEALRPEKYLADDGLVAAANVALMLGQPLLLTGEAGTGKTQFAHSLAWELGLGEPLKFETKSNSTARDLFYVYDALKRFQDVQSGSKSKSILPYLAYQALGLAILYTRKASENTGLVSSDFKHPKKPSRSIVLIDEIDKAPRDFPNDILNEIENMYFRIPEMRNTKVEAKSNFPPIVVITSNSEKDLPDAFLRRCVYYNIPFPDKKRMEAIVLNRLEERVRGKDAFVDNALDIFFVLREEGGLRKNPSTAEMIGWMKVLRDMAPDAENPIVEGDLALHTLSNLIKTKEDRDKAHDIVQQWLTKQK